MTRTQIAKALGVDRKAVYRALKWRHDGWIDLHLEDLPLSTLIVRILIESYAGLTRKQIVKGLADLGVSEGKVHRCTLAMAIKRLKKIGLLTERDKTLDLANFPARIRGRQLVLDCPDSPTTDIVENLAPSITQLLNLGVCKNHLHAVLGHSYAIVLTALKQIEEQKERKD